MQTVPHEHFRPSAFDALERSRVGEMASARTRRFVWAAYYIGLGLLFIIGITVGLLHESPALNEALPPPPMTAP